MFVESDFVYGKYLGQVALVPEPSIIGLLFFGAGFCALFRLIASLDTESPNNSPEPTPIGTVSPQARATSFSPARLSFFR
jgi:hypothetical protein